MNMATIPMLSTIQQIKNEHSFLLKNFTIT